MSQKPTGIWLYRAGTINISIITHISAGQSYGDQITLGASDLSLNETVGLVRHPARFLRIVRLGLVNSLLFERHEQVRGRIRIVAFLFHYTRHFCKVVRRKRRLNLILSERHTRLVHTVSSNGFVVRWSRARPFCGYFR